MSINHFLYSEVKPRYDIYVNNIDSRKITIEEPIDELKFKTQNGDVVNLSSLPDHGLPSQRLTSNGNGNVSWVSGAGTSGIEYSGGEPVQLGKLAKYSAPDGSLVNETSFVDTDILLKDGSVPLTGNLNLNGNSLFNANEIKCNNSYSNVSFTDIIKSELGASVRFQDDIEMKSQRINNCLQVNTTNISGFTAQGDINLNNNEITNCLNVESTDVNVNTISCIAPTTDVKMTCDLDLNGNSILNMGLQNGIQPSGGVYSNTGGFDFSGVTSETDILLSGSSYGSKIIPANKFTAGSIYTLKIGGQITCDNNDIFNIRIVSNFGLSSQCVFSSFSIAMDGAKTNDFWEVEVDFSIRTIGASGVAIITTNGDFSYFSSTAVKKGFGISSVQNTSFNTEIDNELSITYATTDPTITSFQIDQASIMRFF